MAAFDDALPWIIAFGGGTGLGAGIKTLVDTVIAVRNGVSAREGKRKADIVQQRDEALEEAREERVRANFEMSRADWAEANMRVYGANAGRAREHAAELRVLLVEHGVPRAELPPWPEMDLNIPRNQIDPQKE